MSTLAPPFTKEQFLILANLVCSTAYSPDSQNLSFSQIVEKINVILKTTIQNLGGFFGPVAYVFDINAETEVYTAWILNEIGNGVTSTLIWRNCKTCSFTAFSDASPAGVDGITGYVILTSNDIPSGKCSVISQGVNGIKKILYQECKYPTRKGKKCCKSNCNKCVDILKSDCNLCRCKNNKF